MDAQQRKAPSLQSSVDCTHVDSEKPRAHKRAAIVQVFGQTIVHAHAAKTFEEALHVVAQQRRLMIGADQSAISFLPYGSFDAAIHTHSFLENYEKHNS